MLTDHIVFLIIQTDFLSRKTKSGSLIFSLSKFPSITYKSSELSLDKQIDSAVLYESPVRITLNI